LRGNSKQNGRGAGSKDSGQLKGLRSGVEKGRGCPIIPEKGSAGEFRAEDLGVDGGLEFCFESPASLVLSISASCGKMALGVMHRSPVLIMIVNLVYSARRGPVAERNPWRSCSPEWQIPSPVPR
jgi:hypothetical protein